ncbi:hypothetical protein U9M48_041879 [Paspalum notatum var. saurae]|uniref:F-box domain-containing protein n=1 Tax=Paspalum notatum var. saurae TaxID=547442 RepID=A0AAQ3UU64_PASNO
MDRCGGGIAAKRAKLSAGGEDRLSALPDDLLVVILLGLDSTPAAARTTVLSRRWRRVWALLPDIRFHLAPGADGHRIRKVLEAPEAPVLSRIHVTTEGSAGSAAAACWLPAAARRLSGALVYRNNIVDPADEDQLGDSIQLPCFEVAAEIELNLGFLRLALPPHGSFFGLTNLSLVRVRFDGPPHLGRVVSWPRCPCLRELSVHDSSGLQHLSLFSNTLLQMELRKVRGLRRLTIFTPALLVLRVGSSFHDNDPSEPNQPIADIIAPQLKSLVWVDVYDPRYVRLGNLEQLQQLNTHYFFVYGQHQYERDMNGYCLRLLKQFQALHTLDLMLVYPKDIGGSQYMMGDIAMLPQIKSLNLSIINKAHDFGASSFHLLRMCTGLTNLFLMVFTDSNLESTCPSGCICDQSTSWKTEDLVLNHLEYVVVGNLQGAEYEVTFVKQLFKWARVLKRVGIIFTSKISESKVKWFRQAIAGSSRPETCVESFIHHGAGKRSIDK